MEIKNAIKVTTVTLVGFLYNDEYPHSHGNCFSVYTDDNHEFRIVNFNHENFEEAIKRGVSFPIKIGILSQYIAIIHDERIPDNWYSNTFCTICCRDNLLPSLQKFAHDRQEKRGERITKDGIIKIDFDKRPEL